MADITADVDSWSTNEASNQPQGSTTIGSNLDDNLRAIEAAVKLLTTRLPIVPSGRLTLSTAVPVTSSDVTGATTVYYTPYKGNSIQLYDGTNWVFKTFTELSQATTDNTKSPAAVANNSNYDVFVRNDSGTLRATRGPAWTSDTARGTGAGTTELEHFEGRYVNKVAISNGPTARRGLYVGTIRSNGTASIDMAYGGSGAGGSAAMIGVWNMYNRVDVAGSILDSTDSWSYNSTTIRSMNNSTGNRASMVRGLNEDAVEAAALLNCTTNATGNRAISGVCVSATNSRTAGPIGFSSSAANSATMSTHYYYGLPGLGFQFLQAVEAIDTATAITIYGDNAGASGTERQSGLSYRARA